jgi:hypothetical protein
VMLGNVGSHSCTTIWLTLFPSACIRVSGATILDLQNSLELPKTSKCGGPKTVWSCKVLRTCGTHKHIGVAASHGTAQFRSNPLSSNGFWARGFSRCCGAGVGQEVKPRTCRAGGGRVGGSAYSHEATSQQKLGWVSTAPSTTPLYRGAYHPPAMSHMWVPERLCVTYHNPSDKWIMVAIVRNSTN